VAWTLASSIGKNPPPVDWLELPNRDRGYLLQVGSPGRVTDVQREWKAGLPGPTLMTSMEPPRDGVGGLVDRQAVRLSTLHFLTGSRHHQCGDRPRRGTNRVLRIDVPRPRTQAFR
jgi:hypothetical protein